MEGAEEFRPRLERMGRAVERSWSAPGARGSQKASVSRSRRDRITKKQRTGAG
jgi:hypothetical protein